jgi:HD-like signal output (HDOD) protein
MPPKDFHHEIEKLRSIPAAPPTTIKLVQLLGDPDVHSEEVTKVIEYDAQLMAELIRYSNSVVYSSGAKVDSIDQALMRLGYKFILDKAIALKMESFFLRDTDISRNEAFKLWKHSLLAALACGQLAPHYPPLAPGNSAYTAGLVHEIGKVVIEILYPKEGLLIRQLCEKEGISHSEAEMRVLSFTHPEIGSELLRLWKFPDKIIEAVRYHNEPFFAHPNLSFIVYLGSIFADSKNWKDITAQVTKPEYKEKLIDQETAEKILDKIRHEAAAIEHYLLVSHKR